MTKIPLLKVFLYNTPIGTISHLPGDKNLFSFDESYVENRFRPTLSLSFTSSIGELITKVPTTQTRLPPFFANLLPEEPLRSYLAKRANINPVHEFSLLSALGQDLPGALRIEPIDHEFLPLPPSGSNGKKRSNVLRFSLAGVQLKFSAIAKADHGFVIPANGVGGRWILKLPHSVFKGVPENEYSMMELARRVGIEVPETELYPIEKIEGLPKDIERFGSNIFAIKRFDRSENGDKTHIEDFAQVFGVYPEKKYSNASYRNIAEVIWKEIGEEGLVEFIKRFVFNSLIGNGDMHLKNWSLIYRNKTKASLAPAYDFVSTIAYLPQDTLALSFAGSKEFKSLTLDQFKRFAAKSSLPEKLTIDTVQKTVEAFSESWKKASDLPMTKELRHTIEKHLQNLPIFEIKKAPVI